MKTWHIHIKGRVQGVGFRPFVYRIAHQEKIAGWVSNGSDGVHVHFNATEKEATRFYALLINEAPEISFISSSELIEFPDRHYENFEIRESVSTGKRDLLITPDFGLCPDCREELRNSKDRRNEYPFITCTNCGPRYSITHGLPYDRPLTSMSAFEMCQDCSNEFEDPENRRHYSQTNSCPNCSVQLYWLNETVGAKDPIIRTIELLREGKIVAVKGIGGFLLLGDASQSRASIKLRVRKNRPSKPFGMIAPSLKWLKKHCELSIQEEAEIKSSAAPLLLLNFKDSMREEIIIDEIAPGLDRLGFMLPYAPILQLIADRFGKPMIATSANISGSPIVFTDQQAIRELSGIADHILSNNRKIVQPQDDSVVMYSERGNRIVLRRSRGLSPSLNGGLQDFKGGTLATGAMLKSTFALTQKGKVYLSQFHGNTEELISQKSYRRSLKRFKKLIQARFKKVVSDSHPDYFSTHFGYDLARKKGINYETVQHHLAHFGAILGEKNILDCEHPILGVIWDGMGYGTDGHIWGSEFFHFDHCGFARVSHLKPFVNLSGDRMALDPRIPLTSIGMGSETLEKEILDRLPQSEYRIHQTMAKRNGCLKSTSMGRFFDAAACLLGFDRINTYEGESAIWLQQLAEKSLKKTWIPYRLYMKDFQLNPKAILAEMSREIKSGLSRAEIGLRFHQTLVEWIYEVARSRFVKDVAFSGGVFQNALLLDLIQTRMSEEFVLHFHEQLSPNDENIAYGQLVISSLKKRFKAIREEHLEESI